MIQLKSSDGEIFQVEVKVAQLSLHLKAMLDDLGVEENEVISIPQNAPEINGATLKKIIQWGNHHKDDPAPDEYNEKEVRPTDDISSWDAEFLQVDQTSLFQIIRAANYLDIESLLDIACKIAAKMIMGMTNTEVRQRFNIQNDFSPAEDSQVWREMEWCEAIRSEENNERSVNGRVMEKIPADSVQHMDHEDEQVVHDCLCNPIVVKKVMEHISKHQLWYELQFVNKLWSYQARSVMRKRGKVIARLTGYPMYQRQEELEAFGEHLRHLNVVPYSGISIKYSPVSPAVPPSVLDSTFETILDRLPLKYLSVSIFTDWWSRRDCASLLLLKRLFQDFHGVIEELELNICKQREKFIEHFVQDYSLPVLKVLKLQESRNTTDVAYSRYMKALLCRAENLQELHTTGPVSLFENILEGREAVLMYAHPVRAPFQWISTSIVGALRLKILDLKYLSPRFDFERFNRVTPMLLQASSTTLFSVTIDAVFAVPLMCYGICLENVKYLDLDINYSQMEREQPQILRIVKNFDFTRIFPKVTEVKIRQTDDYVRLSAEHLNAIIEQADAVLSEPAPDRAVNVKKLLSICSDASHLATPFFTELLPSIEKLEMVPCVKQEFPFGSIWKHWADLEELDVRVQILPTTGNLDSVFCGIFPEEVAELRQKDEEYLKKVNIVPVMPAITCLKNLKTLKLSYDGRRDETFLDDGTFMFSKVTALIGFARCPALTVSLDITSYTVLPEMNYLMPYVSLKSTLLEADEWGWCD